jgi:hypothetical protein
VLIQAARGEEDREFDLGVLGVLAVQFNFDLTAKTPRTPRKILQSLSLQPLE